MNSNVVRLVSLCALAALLGTCAATSVKKTWKSAECRSPVGKIAVIAVDERGSVRMGFENRFVQELANAGAPAMVTYDVLSLPAIKEDKRAAAERFRASGAQAVIIMRLVDSASFYRESQPGGERYVGNVTGIENMGWYDYYTVGFMSMSPTYGTLTQKAFIETTVYDLTTEKRVWSALSETVMRENMDRVAEMDPLVAKFVAAMQKDGVIGSTGSKL